jgi:O-antigen/teichoic acid export membrane protein
LAPILVLLAWQRLLVELLGLGLPTRILLEASVDFDKGAALARRSYRLIAVCGTMSAGVLGLTVTGFGRTAAAHWITIVLIGATCGAIVRVIAAMLRARGHAAGSITLEFVVPNLAPSLVFLSLAGIGVTLSGVAAGVVVMLANAVPALVGSAISGSMGRSSAIGGSTRRDVAGSLGFMWASLAAVAAWSLPLGLAPVVLPASGLEIFGLAVRVVSGGALVLSGLSSVWCPPLARAATAHDWTQFRKTFHHTRRDCVKFYLPVFVATLATIPIQIAVFKVDATQYAMAVAVICLAQAVNTGTGLTSEALLMARRQTLETLHYLIALVTSCILLIAGGEMIGAVGACAGFAIGLILRNLLSLYAIKIIPSRPRWDVSRSSGLVGSSGL